MIVPKSVDSSRIRRGNLSTMMRDTMEKRELQKEGIQESHIALVLSLTPAIFIIVVLRIFKIITNRHLQDKRGKV